MNVPDDFDRTLADWFEADALSPAPADGLERILDATRSRRPLPAWLAGRGSHRVGGAGDAAWSPSARSLGRLGLSWTTALIVLFVIAAIVGGAILVGARLLKPVPHSGRLGHLAYGLDGDIYLADWDGKNPVRIADGAPGSGPASCNSYWGEGRMWSPDGQYFAYRSASSDRCAGTVVVTDPATKAVASFLGTGWLVSWSPDSTRVASWVDLGNTIGIYGVNGVRQALLSVPLGCAAPGDFDPVWSPDGQSLVVAVCQVPIDGRPAGRVALGDRRSHLKWSYSPDRTHAAYITAESLHVAAADGSHDRELVPTGVPFGGLALVWSPTGDRIAFDAGPASSPANEIRMVDVLTGRVTSLATAPGTESVNVITFSPEGDRSSSQGSTPTMRGRLCGASVPTAPTPSFSCRGPAGAIGRPGRPILDSPASGLAD